ncbi:MAG: sigma-54-dependent Fis family transcriptional regulator, partial [Desulfobulbaceae bacterium]|nr:sigma-54-dependent Fis family transcriptional regulator [Desulfobulbaceae bacterium]
DIPFLVEDFLAEISRKGLGKKTVSESAMAALARHSWPGNVRELRNFMERTAIMIPDEEISEDIIVKLLQPGTADKNKLSGSNEGLANSFEGVSFKDAKRLFEREFLLRRLDENDGNISQTAEQVGLERSHLHKKIKSFTDEEES